MTLQRMDNVAVVVDDLAATVAFFTELGLELEGQATVADQWAARISGFDEIEMDVAMMRVPNGQGRLELMRFHTPAAIGQDRAVQSNTLGIGRLMFTVGDIDDVVTRLRGHGAELLGEIVQFGDSYRLCYVRGPEGFLIGLAEELS